MSEIPNPEPNGEPLDPAKIKRLKELLLDQTTDVSPEQASPKPGSDTLDNSDTRSRMIGPYKLLQPIASGGMGEVWMAEQEKPVRRRVALKLIKAGLDSKQIIARFEAERQALALMDHMNIAKVLDAGSTEEGHPYVVMELVHGIPITQYCDSNKLSIDERLNLFVPVCKAVQHAHQKGIIHRDLKPSNILVTLYDGKPVAKVIDFGLAKALEHQSRLTDKTLFTEFGQVVGTLQYMSPEQAEMNALDIDTRSDIYSLGVLLYELLTGSTPIERATLEHLAILKVLESIRENEPPRPSARLSASGDTITGISKQRQIEPRKLTEILKGDLDWIVMKALEKDRTRRYETANGFAEDITRYLTGDAVVARPPSTAYRVQKFVRKNRGVVVSTFAVAAFLLIATLISAGFGIIANRARIAAKQSEETAVSERNRAEKEREAAENARIAAHQEAERASKAEALAESEADNAKLSQKETEATLARLSFLLSQARWNENREVEAHRLLHSVPVAYRGIEWSMLKRRFEGSDITLYGHAASVTSVAFSPDGGRLASGSVDNTVKVWDARSGAELLTLNGHEDHVTSVSFSLDGARLASGSQDKTVRIWDVSSGVELLTLNGHEDHVVSVSFSPEGRCLVSGAADKTVKVWDALGGCELLTCKGHETPVICVSVSPDGTRLASGSLDGIVKVWDAHLGTALLTINRHKRFVTSVSFSPDGKYLASGSGDNTVKVWDARLAAELLTLKGHESSVTSVSFSPDGARLASGSWDHKLKIWDMRSGNELLPLKGHKQLVSSVTFSPDGARLSSGSWDNTVKVWDARSGAELLTLRGHEDHVTSVSFSPDGGRLASGSWDNTVKVWDARSGAELLTFKGHEEDCVSSVSLSLDGAFLASGADDGTVKIWDVRTGIELMTLTGHEEGVTSVSFSSDGARLASGSTDNTVRVWDARSGKELLTLQGHETYVSDVVFSKDGSRLVSGSGDNTVKVWDAGSGIELLSLKGHENHVTCVALSPDGARLVSGSSDNTIRVWDERPGTQMLPLNGHEGEVRRVSFSPDGKTMFSEAWNNRLKATEKFYWNLFMGSKIESSDPWSNLIERRQSPDGRWFAQWPGFAQWPRQDIQLIDLHHQKSPEVQAYREAKARLDPFWHREMALQAEEAKNWYSAAFHRAWQLRAFTNSAWIDFHLRRDVDHWMAEGNEGTTPLQSPAELRGLLQTVVRESLDRSLAVTVHDEDFEPIAMWFKKRLVDVEKASATDASYMNDIRLGQLALNQSLAKGMWDYADKLTVSLAGLFAKSKQYRLGFRVLHDAYAQTQRPDRAWSEFLFRCRISDYAALVRTELAKLSEPITDNKIEALIDPDIVATLNKPLVATLTDEDARMIQNNEWNRVKAPRPSPTSLLPPVEETTLGLRPVFLSPRSSLQWLELAADQHPSDQVLCTLGITYYRATKYQAAVDTLLKAQSIIEQKNGRALPNIGTSAFLSLSHLKLGNLDEAKKYHALFDDAMKDRFNKDEDNLNFQKEVNETFAEVKE